MKMMKTCKMALKRKRSRKTVKTLKMMIVMRMMARSSTRRRMFKSNKLGAAATPKLSKRPRSKKVDGNLTAIVRTRLGS